ncbi:MAG TPA: hypothetical protein VGO79_02030 [Thermoanaerobaculia bacterium]
MTEAFRWIIGTFIGLNAIWGTVSALRLARRKRAVKRLAGPRPLDAVLESLSWPMIVLWLSSLVLFLASAVLLVLAKPATVVVFLSAFLLDAVVFWGAQRRAAGAAFRARQSLTRQILFGLLAVVSLGEEPMSREDFPRPPDGLLSDDRRRGPLRPVA